MNGAVLYFDDGVPAGCGVGIDLFFLQSDTGLDGITNVPGGVHLLHLTNGPLNTRAGLFVELDERAVYLVSFTPEDDEGDHGIRVDRADSAAAATAAAAAADATSVTRMGLRLADYGTLARESRALVSWAELALGPSVFRYARNGRGLVRTEDCGRVEVERLRRELGGAASDYELELAALEFTATDRRQLVRLDCTGAARTAAFLDGSWLVDQLYGGSAAAAVEECKFVFVCAAVLNNPACYSQFVRVVHLLLNSDALLQRPSEAAAVAEFFRFLYLAVAVLSSIDTETDPDAPFFPWAADLDNDIRSFGPRLDALAGLPRSVAFRWGQLQTLLGLPCEL